MSLIVKKFGGSSLADTHHIFNVAKTIIDTYKKGNSVIVVVSAQGDTTDNLIDMAYNVNKNASKRELDALLATGEQISSSLLAIAIQSLGFPAISLTGWQAGFLTCNTYGNANIIKINTKRIFKELEKKNIVIITGFQGINKNGDITTMGRGGSDTSAVAVASAIKADVCKIYTDVDGVYTVDPRIVPTAKKINAISYEEMLELSKYGAQVLNVRSIKTAKDFDVNVEVLSSMISVSGTIVRKISGDDNIPISGIAVDKNIVKVLITGLDENEASSFNTEILKELKFAGIETDCIFQPSNHKRIKNLTFTLAKNELNEAIPILEKYTEKLQNLRYFYNQNLAKISVVNISKGSSVNIASMIFEALADAGIKVEMVACNETRVSVLVTLKNVQIALGAMHKRFFEEDDISSMI